MQADSKISVIIVNHLTDDIISECLESLDYSRDIENPEIIVVDNPGERSGDIPKIRFPVSRHATSTRLGFGAATNSGAARARGDFLFLLNPDVKVKPDTIRKLIEALENNPSAGLAACRLIDVSGAFQPSCRRFPTLSNMIFSRGSILGRIFRGAGSNYNMPDYAGVADVDAAAAAALMVRRKVFEELCGFDESFFMYMEDTDFCRRAADHGYDTLYVPDAEAVHLWGASTRHYRFRRIIWHHISVYKYFRKHRKRITSTIAAPILLSINCILSLIFELFNLRR